MRSPTSPESRLSPRQLGWSFGATAALFYLGCVITMMLVPREQAVSFFNALLHGIDVGPILRHDVGVWESLLGLISTFILAWFAGALVAGFYNGAFFPHKKPEAP